MLVNVVILVALTVTFCGAGCAKKRAPAQSTGEREWDITRPLPTTTTAQQRALPIKAPVTLVQQGRTPLVYLVETGDPIYIIVSDLTENQNLARIPVAGRTIVRVESEGGVIVGAECIRPGPLPANHAFGISVEAVQDSVIRREITQPQQGNRR